MYCDRCGTPIYVGHRFCATCGAPLVLPRVQATGDPLRALRARVACGHGAGRQATEAVPRQAEVGGRTAPLPPSAFRLPSSNLAPVTLGLLLVLAVVFIMESVRPGGSESRDVLYAFGATTPDTITSGQLWRLVAATFLHIGLVHLVGNAMALFWLGRMAERLYGPLRFLGFYLLAGLGGSLLTVLAGTQALSAGASGAIWGLMGALLIGSWRNTERRGRVDGREIRQSITGAIILNVIVSLTPGVSLTAHLGGFLVGGMLAWAIPFRGGERRTSAAFADTLCGAGIIAAALLLLAPLA